jgi:hypothetical protein
VVKPGEPSQTPTDGPTCRQPPETFVQA